MNVADDPARASAAHPRISQSTAFAVLAGALAVGVFALIMGGVDRAEPHYYYAPAVRSMSDSWRAFAQGSLDPAGSITLDKMPGAFWLQAISARCFGYSHASLALPQALLAAATVFVLFDTVRRWAGAAAGLGAALAFAFTPITIALARIDIPDTALIFCQVCAAHATVRAVQTGFWRPLLAAAVWLGLAFQVKMIQAFAVLPAMALAYLLAAPGPLRARIAKGAGALAVTAAISMSWPLAMALTPKGARPYIDGSIHDSVWEMIFGYNGLGRWIALHGIGRAQISASLGGEPGALRLFGSTLAPQIGWLLPFSLLALATGIALRRGAPRTCSIRAGWLLWGGWLLVHAVEFSTTSEVHPYYTAALAPAVGALAGAGFAAMVREWKAGRRTRWLLPASVLGTAGWSAFVTSSEGDYLPWVRPLAIGLAVLGCGALAYRLALGLAVAAAAMLLGPAAWALAAAGNPMKGLSVISPMAGPARPLSSSTLAALHGFPPHVRIPASAGDMHMSTPNAPLLAYVTAHHRGERYLFAVPTANTAAPYLRAGYSVLPMGGFTGSAPMPTLGELSRAIEAGHLRYAVTGGFHATMGGAISRERQDWIKAHCQPVPPADYENTAESTGPPGNPEVLFDCRPPVSPEGT
ncbi:ArnT family glycosyltransferase [Pendulispora albinea]|uniref:Glycosyltransferase family 39 protein n=1 Tax=Pendulispora albinea TaxID=2741071 RepID=A0ABZ2M547_9BACT